MYKFSSGLANQKDDFFMSTHFKLVMIVLLTVVLLGGCGGETKVIGQPPVITMMDVTWDTVVVAAEDDKEVVGYIITTSKDTPVATAATKNFKPKILHELNKGKAKQGQTIEIKNLLFNYLQEKLDFFVLQKNKQTTGK